MTTTILVTGATGMVGSAVVNYLAQKSDVLVRAAVRTVAQAGKFETQNVRPVELDLNRPETVDAAFVGVDKLFLLTPMDNRAVAMAHTLVDAARKHGIKHIVKMSAFGADVEPGIELGRLHREAELAIEESGIPWTHIRPNNFMQNFLTYFGATVRSEGTIYLPLGEGRVSYVDARDIGAVAAEVLTTTGHDGQAYVLTGPEALNVHEVAALLTEGLGRTIKYIDVPEDVARNTMLGMGMPAWAVDGMMELHLVNKLDHASVITNTIQQVTRRLPISFKQFATELAPTML